MNNKRLIIGLILGLVIILSIFGIINYNLNKMIQDNNSEITRLQSSIDDTRTVIDSYNSFMNSLTDSSEIDSIYQNLTEFGTDFAKAEEDYINSVVKFREENPDATASYIPDNDKIMKNLRKHISNETYDSVKTILWYDKPCKVSFDSRFEIDGNRFNVVWTVWDDNEIVTVVTGKYNSEAKQFEDIMVHWLDR